MPLKPGQIIKQLVALPDDPTTGCWEWLGAKNQGYGVKEYAGVTQPAARWVYAIFRGQVRSKEVLEYTCGNRSCVSPFHLRKVGFISAQQGRVAKLSHDDVRAIRAEGPTGIAAVEAVAERHHVDPTTIYRVLSRESFRNVDPPPVTTW